MMGESLVQAAMTPILGTVFGLPVAVVNWHSAFFLLFSCLACTCAVAVVLADNVVRMAFYLVLSLAATAGLFFLAGAEFVGAMQLMIYVGGTLVLLVFGVMLTAQAPFVSIKTPLHDKVLAGIVGAALFAVLLQANFRVESWRQPAAAAVGAPAATPIGMALLGMRVDEPSPASSDSVRGGYLLPFEIVSVHLLVVLVGAAYLARAKRRRSPRPIDVAASSVGAPPVPREAAHGDASRLVSGGNR